MITASLSLVGALVFLVITGTAIVRGASTIGLRLGLPPLVIGLTIVAAGTSAPELAVTWRAADAGDVGLALGNVIGSNIANVLLILGIVAILGAIPVERRTRRVEIPVMAIASVATVALSLDGTISRIDGILLLTGLGVYVTALISNARRSPGDSSSTLALTNANPKATQRPDGRRTLLAVAMFAAGVVGVAISAQFVVSAAETIALELGVPELVVGLTVLAIGTSSPEIATSLIAAFRGATDVAIGNAIGSNVFNLLFVLGLVSSTHSDLPIDDALLSLDLPVMVAAAICCIPFAITGARITRWEGVAFLVLYGCYTAYLVLNATENRFAGPFGTTTLVVVLPVVALLSALEFRRDRRVRLARVAEGSH